MLGEIGPLTVALVLPVGGMAALAVQGWWQGKPRASVLSTVFVCLAFASMFVAFRGVKVFGLPESIGSVAVAAEVVFVGGAIYFLRQHRSAGGATAETG